MNDWPTVAVEKDEAVAALTAAAHTDEESGRVTVHSRLNGLGADHDLETALEHVAQADEIVWATNMLQHDLAVVVDGQAYLYDVPRPERSQHDPDVLFVADATRQSDIELAVALVEKQQTPTEWRDGFRRVKFDTADNEQYAGERWVVIVAKAGDADRLAQAYEEIQ